MLEEAAEIDHAIADDSMNCGSKKKGEKGMRSGLKRESRESISLSTNCIRGNKGDKNASNF